MTLKPPSGNTKDMSVIDDIIEQMKGLASEERAAVTRSFFKIGKGTYSEHDQFIGIRVPILRQLAKDHIDLSLDEVLCLLDSPIHEQRHLALLIWTLQYKHRQATAQRKDQIYNAYIRSWKHINNWDLVDTTTPHIMGEHLINRPRQELYDWSAEPNMWKRRMSIVATWAFIKRSELDDTFTIALTLLGDREDLIQKAVGWMLREAGKRDQNRLVEYLEIHRHKMPRTMLRSSIEKFSAEERSYFLDTANTKSTTSSLFQ